MKKIKTAVAAAALAGVALTAAPASAVAEPMHCTSTVWGGEYLCGGEFGQPGMAEYAFRDGRREVFVIGTDHAVWTRWTDTSGRKSAWTSLGGYMVGGIGIIATDTGGGNFEIGAKGTDGHLWGRSRAASGSWTAWYRIS
ncbi:hypothetical protein [Streptomyces sp. NRRL S-350]|uniref:hypothetical protein n=1 Tax=Streptomyces sp. NRRL S-350 TaxID=1463902 RepID=UPI000691DE4A|nr:hypothetical protein [Streptomyces sp. NRRL S-350]